MVGRHQETTDDAYVSGNVVSVMSQVSGRVEKVLVRDHQYVKAGERLIVIDPTDAKLALDAALSFKFAWHYGPRNGTTYASACRGASTHPQ